MKEVGDAGMAAHPRGHTEVVAGGGGGGGDSGMAWCVVSTPFESKHVTLPSIHPYFLPQSEVTPIEKKTLTFRKKSRNSRWSSQIVR